MMKRLIIVCLWTFLKIDNFQADIGADDATPFQLSNEGDYYMREIRYPNPFEVSSEFINVFDYDFFTEERENKTNLQDIVNYIRQGIKSFQISTAGFYKLSQNYRKKSHVSDAYVEPLHLPNITITLNNPVSDYSPTVAEFESPAVGNIYNVKLNGLVAINVTNMMTSSVDAEYLALFHVNSESTTKAVTFCGQHSLKNNQQSLHGSFCYEIFDITYKADYSKVRTNTGDVLTSQVGEEIHFGRQNYTDLTFSTDRHLWSKLRTLHTEALNSALINNYLLVVSRRFRNIIERNTDFLIAQEGFIDMYQSRVFSTIVELVRLYLKKLNNNLTTTDSDRPLIMRNFSRFLNAYSEHDRSADDKLTCNVNVTLYYSEHDNDTVVLLKSDRYIVRTLTLMFTVRLVNEIDVEELTNVRVTKIDLDLTLDHSTPIDSSSNDYVRSVLKSKISNFVKEVVDDECDASQVEKNKNRPRP